MHVIWTPRSKSGRPTLFSMLIIIAAHIPIFTLQRHEGRIFAPMAYSVTSALIASLIFSLTLVPLLCYLLLRKKLPHHDNALVERCKTIYQPVLNWALAHRKLVVLGAAGALAGKPRGGAATRHRISARTERRLDLAQRAAASERVGDRGVDRDGAHAGCAEENPGNPHRRLQGRAAGGRHRSQADQHGRDPGRPEAGIGMDARPQQARSHARDATASCRRFPACRRVSRSRSATTSWRAFRRSTARSWSRYSATISPCCATARRRCWRRFRTCRACRAR